MDKLRIAAALISVLPALQAANKPTDVNAPTYAKEVSRIIQKNCEGCHRPGQVGPFALTSYKEASAFAPEVKRVTQARIMPPWHAVQGYGEFKNERRLTDADIETLARWAEAGAPMGNPKDLPPLVKYSEEWALGTPDSTPTAGRASLTPHRSNPPAASGRSAMRVS